MKKLLIALLSVLPLAAQADVVATMPNKDGGLIVVTSYDCHKSQSKMVVATTGGGMVQLYGCASMLSDDLVFVKWSDGGTSIFKAAAFTVKQPTNPRKF